MVPFRSTALFLIFHLQQASVGQLINCLLAKPSLKKQAAGWLLQRYEREERTEKGERISEGAPGGPFLETQMISTPPLPL